MGTLSVDCHTLGRIIWGGGVWGQGGDVILDPLICTHCSVSEPKTRENQGLIQVMEKVYSYVLVHMHSDFFLVFIKLLYKFFCPPPLHPLEIAVDY